MNRTMWREQARQENAARLSSQTMTQTTSSTLNASLPSLMSGTPTQPRPYASFSYKPTTNSQEAPLFQSFNQTIGQTATTEHDQPPPSSAEKKIEVTATSHGTMSRLPANVSLKRPVDALGQGVAYNLAQKWKQSPEQQAHHQETAPAHVQQVAKPAPQTAASLIFKPPRMLRAEGVAVSTPSNGPPSSSPTAVEVKQEVHQEIQSNNAEDEEYGEFPYDEAAEIMNAVEQKEVQHREWQVEQGASSTTSIEAVRAKSCESEELTILKKEEPELEAESGGGGGGGGNGGLPSDWPSNDPNNVAKKLSSQLDCLMEMQGGIIQVQEAMFKLQQQIGQDLKAFFPQ